MGYIERWLLRREIKKAKLELVKFDRYLFYSYHPITLTEKNMRERYQEKIDNLERHLKMSK